MGGAAVNVYGALLPGGHLATRDGALIVGGEDEIRAAHGTFTPVALPINVQPAITVQEWVGPHMPPGEEWSR